jgi:HlyD family secretion protein
MMKKKALYILPAIVLVLAVIFVLIRVFSNGKIGPESVVPEKPAAYPNAVTVDAAVETVTQWYDAVGTVVPKTRARIEPRITAQVIEVMVQAGDPVKKGDLLIRLEDDRLQARLSQARQQLESAMARRDGANQGINAAKADFDQAESAYRRVKTFYEAEAATKQEFEEVRSRFLQARAALERSREALSGAESGMRLAEEVVREARISTADTEITAPADGTVLERLVDPGDMAMPGKPVLNLRTTETLQLEANVRESLINRVQPGDTLSVHLTTLDKTVQAVISQIVPFIDPRTRTFLLKADLPDMENAYTGMYGKLLIPYTDMPVILIPPRSCAPDRPASVGYGENRPGLAAAICQNRQHLWR